MPELSEEDRARLEEERQAREAAAEVARANAEPRADRIPSIAELIDPDATVPRQACPAEALEERLGPSIIRHVIPSATYASLRGAETETEAWRWLNDSMLSDWERVRAREDGLTDHFRETAGDAAHSYLVVFVHQERALPSITRNDGILRAGSYDEGYYAGGLYVVDVDSATVICSAPFEAESSDTIDGDDDFDEALEDDFREQVEDAANAALRDISDALAVNVHGIF